MNIKRFFALFLFAFLLLIFSACSENNSLSAESTKQLSPLPSPYSIVTKTLLLLSPTSVPSETPTLSPTLTATLSPVPIDYSKLSPLSTLIVDGTHFPEFNIHIPDVLFQKPPTPFDETNSMNECYIDCVKVAWGGSLGTLTITMIRATNHEEALHILAEEYNLFKKNYSEKLLGFVDEYIGGNDDIWAAQASATPAYAKVHGPIFMSLIWEITSSGLDVDTPWHLGQISCLAQYQFDWIDAQIRPETKIMEPDNSCMITR